MSTAQNPQIPQLNPQATFQQLLTIIGLAAGAAAKIAGGEVGEYAQLAADVTRIAQIAVSVHAQNSGLPIEQVVAQIHEIPGPQAPQPPATPPTPSTGGGQ